MTIQTKYTRYNTQHTKHKSDKNCEPHMVWCRFDIARHTTNSRQNGIYEFNNFSKMTLTRLQAITSRTTEHVRKLFERACEQDASPLHLRFESKCTLTAREAFKYLTGSEPTDESVQQIVSSECPVPESHDVIHVAWICIHDGIGCGGGHRFCVIADIDECSIVHSNAHITAIAADNGPVVFTFRTQSIMSVQEFRVWWNTFTTAISYADENTVAQLLGFAKLCPIKSQHQEEGRAAGDDDICCEREAARVLAWEGADCQ